MAQESSNPTPRNPGHTTSTEPGAVHLASSSTCWNQRVQDQGVGAPGARALARSRSSPTAPTPQGSPGACCAGAGTRPSSRRSATKSPPANAAAGGPRTWTPGSTRTATSSNEPSPWPSSGAPSPPATTSSPSPTAPPSCWPPASPGHGYRRHALVRAHPPGTEPLASAAGPARPDRDVNVGARSGWPTRCRGPGRRHTPCSLARYGIPMPHFCGLESRCIGIKPQAALCSRNQHRSCRD